MILLLYSRVQFTDNVPLLKVMFILSNFSNEVRDTILTIAGAVMDYSDGLLPTRFFFLFEMTDDVDAFRSKELLKP